jgi:hypothetical protein
MTRLLKALLLGAAATGAAYLVMHLIRPAGESGQRAERRLEDLDEETLTREEKEALLRELGTYL